MNESELLKYYIKHTDERFREINQKLDVLLRFRWMLIGASLGASVLVSAIFEITKAIAGVP